MQIIPFTLQAGVNFINILRANFLYESLLSSFSRCLEFSFEQTFVQKCTCKMMMRLTTGANFINVLLTIFLYKSAFSPKCKLEKSCQKKAFVQKKCACKTLMKLTTDENEKRASATY